MALTVTEIDHVQVMVPAASQETAKHFYGAVLGLQEIPKPNNLRNRGGAWYRVGRVELHLSVEDLATDNKTSRRHVCLVVADLLEAEAAMREAGIDIIPDDQPIEGWRRLYVRDPGGNRLEIAERCGAI